MNCVICEIHTPVGACVDCRQAVCNNCSTRCQHCQSRICARHVHVTPHGRKLCGACFERRAAKLREREQRKQREKDTKPSQAAATGFDALKESRVAVLSSTAMERLMATHHPTEEAGEDPYADEEKKKTPGTEAEVRIPGLPADGEDYSFKPLTEEGRVIAQAPPEKKKPLVIDDGRPALVRSGYQSPTRTGYIIAFLAFGLVGLILFATLPELRTIMWPREASGPSYDSTIDFPPIQDRNTIRDTRNVPMLQMIPQLALFCLAWGIVLAYAVALGVLAYAAVRSWARWAVTKLEFRRDQRFKELEEIHKKRVEAAERRKKLMGE